MKKIYGIFCLFLILIISGRKEKINIDLNDYKPLEDYSFQEDDFVMRKGKEEIDILGGIYTLKGFSYKDYVGHVQYYLIPGAPTRTLYANIDKEEPIMCYDPYRILLAFDVNEFVIKDKTVVEQLVEVRRKGGIQTSLYPDIYADRRIYMGFLFDVPSDLEWSSQIVIEDKNIKWLWYDNENQEEYVSDITDILKQHSITDDIYSLVK